TAGRSREPPAKPGAEMSARSAVAVRQPQKGQRELEDLQLVLRARNSDAEALDALIPRYTRFVPLQASSYFLAGGGARDLTPEGCSYDQMADELSCDTKTIDNALQRVKRKVLTHQRSRQVLN